MRQILHLPDSSGLLHALDQQCRHFSPIESVGALIADAFQHAGQLRLPEHIAGFGHAALLQENRSSSSGLVQVVEHGRGQPLITCTHLKTLMGMSDGRVQGEIKRKPPVPVRQVDEGCREAWDACSQGTYDGLSGGPASIIQIHVLGRCKRCHLPSIQHDIASTRCRVQQPETAAAQPRGVGLHHSQTCGYRYGRIEGVAALTQDIDACLGGQWMGTGHSIICEGRPGQRA